MGGLTLCLSAIYRVKSVTTEIRKRSESGEKVYMHCWGGRGRAGTLGACLLGDLYGIDAEEALLRVQKAFSTRGDAGADPQHISPALSVRPISSCSQTCLPWKASAVRNVLGMPLLAT